MRSNYFCSRAWSLYLSIVILAVQGCAFGDLPSSLRIDTGDEPAYRDDDVRFRTTYYFRVVDSCQLNSGAEEKNYDTSRSPFRVKETGKLKIVNDTLYRFRMSGKGSALFNQIHFESGVLRAEQIDPFGTAIVLDEVNNVFTVKSASSFRDQDKRKAIQREIDQLRELYRDLAKGKVTEPELFDDGSQSLRDAIKAKIQLLATATDISSPATSDAGNQDLKKGQKTILCPEGRPAKQSYLLYGPEGVRELDPDERLLMAMSSSSKPLIGMLQQLSGKQLRESQRLPSNTQEIANERAWIFALKKKLTRAETALEPSIDLEELPSSSGLIKQLLDKP